MTHASSLHAARRRWPLARWVAGIVLALCVVLPVYALATGHAFMLALMTRIVVLAIAAVALNLVLGFGGMVSFGHALFLGLGVYSAAIPAFHGLDNGLLHLLIALAACGLTGLATGAVALRTQGIAFIMITLAFAQMFYFVFVSLSPYGGDDGLRLAAGSRLAGLTLTQPGVNGGPPGDLYVEIHLKPHGIFTRDGDDLHCELTIPFTTAALGGELEVPTLTGRGAITIPEGTQTGKTFRLRGKGIRGLRSSYPGDLYCHVSVETPVRLNEEQKKLLRQFEQSLQQGGEKHSPNSQSWRDRVKNFFS